jgi:SpoVK/Ycf46/Vps4 family AAA+-type ATPase
MKEENNNIDYIIKTLIIDPNSIDTTWEDIIGLEEVIETLKQSILLPLKFPKMFLGLRKPWFFNKSKITGNPYYYLVCLVIYISYRYFKELEKQILQRL